MSDADVRIAFSLRAFVWTTLGYGLVCVMIATLSIVTLVNWEMRWTLGALEKQSAALLVAVAESDSARVRDARTIRRLRDSLDVLARRGTPVPRRLPRVQPLR